MNQPEPCYGVDDDSGVGFRVFRNSDGATVADVGNPNFSPEKNRALAQLVLVGPELIAAAKAICNGLSREIDDYPDMALYRHTMNYINRLEMIIEEAEEK